MSYGEQSVVLSANERSEFPENEMDFGSMIEAYDMEVIVGVEHGTSVPPDLAQQLDDRLTEATGYEGLTVRVALLDEQVSD